MLLALGGTIYPLWWLLTPVDSLTERLVVSSVWWVMLAASFDGRVARRLDRITFLTVYVLTAHHFSLVWRSGGAAVLVAVTSVVLASSVLTCLTVRRVIAYSLFVVGLATAVHATIPHHHALSRLFLPAVVTIQVVLAASTWRSIAVRSALSREIDEAGRFLGLVIDAVPDPIFVEDSARRWVLVNQAFARMRGTSRDELIGRQATDAPCVDETPADGAADGSWVEREHTFDGRTFATKVALGHTRPGSRALVGVMRDVTERKQLERSLAKKVDELQRARNRVRQLEGLLPVCMHCRRIRTDDGRWEQIEQYVQARSDAVFTHGVCCTCLDAHHPE